MPIRKAKTWTDLQVAEHAKLLGPATYGVVLTSIFLATVNSPARLLLQPEA